MRQEEPSERLEREAGRMEDESERVGGVIEGVRRDWESKEQDAAVPGAQPDPGEEDEESVAGVDSDEEQLDEEGGP